MNDYSKDGLSLEQQAALLEAFASVKLTVHNGLRIATATCWLPGYVNGLARVAQDMLGGSPQDMLAGSPQDMLGGSPQDMLGGSPMMTC